MFTNLVPDVAYQILSGLNARELCKISEVSKDANQLIAKNNIWIKFFPKIQVPKELTLKEYFNVTAIVSSNQLIKRLEDFCSKLNFNQNGEFYCYFPPESKCFFGLRILNNPKTQHIEFKERNWFMETTFPMKASRHSLITIGKDKKFLINTRLSNDLNMKITAIVVNIITKKNLEVGTKREISTILTSS